jgi:pantetheine-phosphate adenylyltransferase
MKVCVGGTFNRFHKGHQTLLDTAIQFAGHKGFLFIGIASGPLVKKRSHLELFERRRDRVIEFLKQKNIGLPVTVIEPITTVEGPTLILDFDAIVVSKETKHRAEYINEKRKKRNLKPLKIISIPLVLAEDNEKISSTRIIDKEIDEHGHLL